MDTLPAVTLANLSLQDELIISSNQNFNSKQMKNNMLSNVFDDVSSISDNDPLSDTVSNDFDLSGYELNDENRNVINLKTPTTNAIKSQRERRSILTDLTSTPKHVNVNGGVKDRFCPNNSTIQEETLRDEHDPDVSFVQRVPVNSQDSKKFSTSKDKPNSVWTNNNSENHHHSLHSKSPSKMSPGNSFALSHQHVQSLLDSNSQLSRELQVTRQMLSAANHDLEKLRMSNERQNVQLIDLESKTTAFDTRLKAETEIKADLMKKLAIAEQTISSLKVQLIDSSKVTSLVQIRESNEALIAKLKQEHHHSMQNLLAERERLLNRLEEANEQIKVEQSKRNQPCTLIEPVSDGSHVNRKYEEHLKSSLQVEFDVRIAEKEKIIAQLEQKLNDANEVRNTSKQLDASNGSCCMQKSKCEIIHNLKNELEKSIDVSKHRRDEVDKLQDQLIRANSDLQSAKLELEQCRQNNRKEMTDYIHKDEHARQIQDIKQSVEQLDTIRNELEEQVQTLKGDNEQLLQQLANQQKVTKESEAKVASNTFSLGTNQTSHNDSLKELVSHTMGQWKKQSESHFSQQIAEQNRATRIHLLQELEEEVRRLVEQLDRAVDVDENGCIRVRLSAAHQKETSKAPEIKLILQPLRRLWLFLIESLAEKQSLIRHETEELRAARTQLEQSILNSESIEVDDDQISCQSAYALQQLEELKQANETLQTKLTKYRKQFNLLRKRQEIELQTLRDQCGQALNHHEQSFVSREREMLRRFKQDSNQLLHQLDNKYNDLQIKMRRDLDELSDSHTKHRIYERILRILSHFHEYALERIREHKSNHVESSNEDDEDARIVSVEADHTTQDAGPVSDQSVSFMRPPTELSPQCAHFLQSGRS